MKKKILSHTGFMIVLTAILTFIAASFLMYEKFDDVMKRTVRDETEYVKAGMEKAGEDYLSKRVGDNTGTRITLTDENGKVLYDSEADASKLPNHSNRPEFVQAMEEGRTPQGGFGEEEGGTGLRAASGNRYKKRKRA